MEKGEARLRWIWLSAYCGGAQAFGRVMQALGGERAAPEAAWEEPERLRKLVSEAALERLKGARSLDALEAMLVGYERQGVRALTKLDARYPDALRDIPDSPPTLYLLGEEPAPEERAIGVVGSRNASLDGLRAARDFARALGEAGITVVSGLARGIDAAAHEGALDAKARTFAVLGGGVLKPYPAENVELMRRIVGEGGCALSESPPEARAYPYTFPLRNRIISGLSRGVLLVEGGAHSGSLITLDWAKKQGRDRFAIPGSIYAPSAAAPNALIRDGALPALSAEDILARFGWNSAAKSASKERPALNENEEKVTNALRIEEMSFDELAAHTGINSAALNSVLTILAMREIIRAMPGRRYQLNLTRFEF